GLVRALENMAKNNQVGLVGFSETIHTLISIGQSGFEIADAAQGMRARGETALYDAIKAGIEMADAAEGPEDAIPAVVVLTDGRANRGQVKLHDLIQMSSRDERPIQRFGGFVDDAWAVASGGGRIHKADLIGEQPALVSRHPIQVFFIGIGDDADLDVGRMLAEATGAEFQGVREKDLASVLEEFSKYF
ncbi:MAG: VWA domain-containing protein, partial [Dehalococcoidia bacterium]